jgi:hypothetical protein
MFLRRAFSKLLKPNRDREHLRRVLAAYQEVFVGDAADMVLDDLCFRFGVFDPKPSKSPDDALRREGARRVVVFLMSVPERHADLSNLLDEVSNG